MPRQPVTPSSAPLPVIIAEIRTQRVEIQGEPQSAAHQLCNHLSTAFRPARLPARGQQRQQKPEASIPTFRRLLPASLFPRFPTLPSSVGSFQPTALLLLLARLRSSCVLPGCGLTPRSPCPAPASGERRSGSVSPGRRTRLVLRAAPAATLTHGSAGRPRCGVGLGEGARVRAGGRRTGPSRALGPAGGRESEKGGRDGPGRPPPLAASRAHGSRAARADSGRHSGRSSFTLY